MNWAVKRLIINEEIHMGKKINIEASDEPCMFQFFKKYIHQTDKNEFYCDNRVVDISNPNPGVVVDFKNIDHTYEVFAVLGNYWGGWNSTPTAAEMYNRAKEWEERFGTEIVGLSYNSVDFVLNRKLSDIEIEDLIKECEDIQADAACSGGYEEKQKIIREKGELHIWWD